MSSNTNKSHESGFGCFCRSLMFGHLFAHARRVNSLAKDRENGPITNNDQKPHKYEIILSDLPDAPNQETAFDYRDKFQAKLQDRHTAGTKINEKQVLKSLYLIFRGEVLWPLMCVFISCALSFGKFFILQFLIESLMQKNLTLAYILALLYTLVLFSAITCENNTTIKLRIFAAKLRSCLVATIFHKISKLSQFTITKNNLGKITNMLSNDFNLIEIKMPSIFGVIILPFLLIGCTVLFVIYLGAAGLIVVGFSLAFYPIQIILAKVLSIYLQKANIHKDKRIQMTQELLSIIQFIKINGWEEKYQKSISEQKNKQFGYSVKLAFFNSICYTLSQSLMFFGILITFLVASSSQQLSLSVIISCLYLNNILRFGTGVGALGLDLMANLYVSLKRFAQLYNTQSIQMIDIDEFPEIENKNKSLNCHESSDNLNCRQYLQEPRKLKDSTILRKFRGFWEKQGLPVLDNIDLQIQNGKFYGLSGSVGSGKTTLFQAILSALPYKTGYFYNSKTLSYLEQQPILFAGTIQYNIVNSSKVDKERYEKVIKSVCLVHDFEQLTDGDQTIIGQNGVTLSGGQKARVGLARALYKEADLYLFDDPFAAIDTKIAKQIYQRVFKGWMEDKTFILSTHQVQFIAQCDILLHLENGKLVEIKKEENSKKLRQLLIDLRQNGQSMEQIIEEKPREFTNIEEPEKNMSFKLFFKYAFFSNKALFIIAVLLFLVSESLIIAFIRLMSLYELQIDGQTGLSIEMFWGLGFIFVVSYFFVAIIRNFFLYLNFLKSSKSLHDKMLHSICRSKNSYFDVTPSGILFNRFSNDIGVLDVSFIYIIESSLQGPAIALVSFVNISEVSPYFLIALAIFIPAMIFGYMKLQKLILHSKKLDIEAKNPVFSKLGELVNGVLEIKMFITESEFMNKINFHITESLKANIFYWMNGKLLSIIIAYVLLGIMIVICFVGIILIESPNEYAFSILFIETLSFELNWSFINFILLKSHFESVIKCMNLTEIAEEKPYHLESDKKFIQGLKTKSTQAEAFSLANFKMKYRPQLPIVLKDIAFSAKKGQKIGLVGRTGSGKSSIINSLLRLSQPEEGSQYFFGESNALQLGLHTLRHQIAVVPQKSVFMKGTIRSNLTIEGDVTDQKLWEALENVELRIKIASLNKGLDTEVSNSSSSLSVGERQLFCLARALIKKSDIILMDEATSHVDKETSNKIIKILNENFEEKTVITIAHNLTTIAGYDKVLVLDDGRVKQSGSPRQLLEERGQFYEMVQNSQQKTRQIIKIAEESQRRRSSRVLRK